MFIIMQAKSDGIWEEIGRAASFNLAEIIAQNAEDKDEDAYIQVFEWKSRKKKN